MNIFDSENAIRDYKTAHGIINKDGMTFRTRVKAEDFSGVIVDENIECRFIRNDGLDYSEIELIWTFDDNCMHRLGLHGGYRSDYQGFSFVDGSLVIKTDDLITITVY